MTARNVKNAILPKLLAGSRDGLPLDAIGATDPLQALTLAGQALRFDRPAQPSQFQIDDPILETAEIMPDQARKLLLRLLSGKNQTLAQLSSAIVRKLAERKLRLHPFDLPKLEFFVRANAESLGAEALAFSERETPVAQKQSYFAADRLNDENWMLATPAVKAGYIGGRRASDPDAARALVEAAWSSENADSRVRLLGAFREHLSEADAPFLAGLEKDRAPRVRELAHKLHLRLPGFNGDNPALRNALERIKVGKAGLVFKKTALSLELPATVKSHGTIAWLSETFSSVGLESLADALSMSVEAIVAAAEKQSTLLVALLLMATQDKRLDVVKTITDRHLLDSWEAFSHIDADILADYNPDMLQRWVEYVFRPNRWTADTSAWMIHRTAQWLDGEATENLFKNILQSTPWQSRLKDPARIDAHVADSMAVMCPPSLRVTLRSELAALEPAKSGNATLFLDLMDSLETAHA
ncbi:DUF5691 domain-containing protein [Pararhizobium sp. BT-229]|uniref:DUF5691 domain-containing protein n=1 Tax=Pararhizobium sp. BT-229 TaxID=2986923 RepID=UPI0021F7F8BA|nr:DUF5691 domain-containing protein [Pararhizobium sp. BT-229]MCV9962705.1 DUF5691 domain-containing protein [Pararhizobium sp. BT-229]